MTKENNKNELFRLAAVLYADNNYEVSTKVIHRKILDSALLDCENADLSIHSIIDYISEKYSILMSEEEIHGIIENYPESFLVTNKNSKIRVCLSPKRKHIIEKKLYHRNIDFFIDKFSLDKEDSVSTKKLIYDFLYHMFSVNTASFQRLIDKERDISELLSLQDSNYDSDEIETINEFLNWDNAEKNKAIFDISSYALEFCLLTNKKGTKNFKINNLRNKTFYLDTNVIYRALGINGEDRKKRTKTFLEKFKEAGENLYVTKITDNEFINSIKFYIDKLRKVQNPKVNSKVFLEFRSLNDINTYYHKWRKDKINHSLDIFESYVISEYKSLLESLNISIDYKVPYDIEDKETREYVNDLYSSINKEKPSDKYTSTHSTLNDAENILWIEKKRGGKIENIFDTSHFFISTDNSLRKWDYYRGFSTPIVLLPSQWMSILLRYFDRTKDDYKSFVSFLNLRNNEKIIEGEKLNLVMSGISEMTSDVQQQRFLVSSLIEKNFQGVISKQSTNEEIIEQSRKFAKSELEKSLKTLNTRVEKLETEKSIANSKLIDLESQAEKEQMKKEQLTTELFDNQTKKTTLSEEVIRLKVNGGIRKWRRPLFVLIPLALLIIIFYILLFFVGDTDYNLAKKVTAFIDEQSSDSVKGVLQTLLYLPFGALGWIIVFSFKRFYPDFVKNKKEDLKQKLEKELRT